MDDEAASRGTTVYLVDKRIDMLPSLLGTSTCYKSVYYIDVLFAYPVFYRSMLASLEC